MNVIGVVGEFNPLHLGHREHFQMSRAQLGGDTPIVCVMSGDFVQRGEPACFDKHVRARTAVMAGADLVFELPLPWCMASAERFALGAAALLDALGVVTHLSFGSESGDLAALQTLAAAAADENNLALIRERMRRGEGFAAAREAVLRRQVGETAALLERPNDILAVEYLKALTALGSAMIPMVTRRQASEHDGAGDGPVRSAMRLRAMLAAGEDIGPYVPDGTGEILAAQMAAGRGPVTAGALEQAILARLRAMPAEAMAALPDAGEGLANRLFAARQEGSMEAAVERMKTKRYPTSRLRRLIMAAALGVQADMAAGTPPYARLLAYSDRGRALLRQIREHSALPVVNKPAAAKDLPEQARAIFRLNADARDLYVLGYESPEERRGGSDWRTGPAAV